MANRPEATTAPYQSLSSLIRGKSLWTALYSGTSAVTPSAPKFPTNATKQASYTAELLLQRDLKRGTQDRLCGFIVQRRSPQQLERRHRLRFGLESSVKPLPNRICNLD